MADLYLFEYNNYFNRLLKVEQSIEGYGIPLHVLQNTNFNPNNGVSATHIVNADFPEAIPDYCVITENGIINSRWYVMEVRRIRAGQYRLELLRDVMAEYKTEILNSTAFIQKGFVPNSSPLIFNNENIGFNQVKSGEYLLRNKLNTPWIVLYLSRFDNDGNYNKFTGSFNDDPPSFEADYTLESLGAYKFNYYKNTEYFVSNQSNIRFEAGYRLRGFSGQQAERIMRRSEQSFEYNINSSVPSDTPLADQNKVLVCDNDDYLEMLEAFNSGYSDVGGLPVNSYLNHIMGAVYSAVFGNINGYNELKQESGKTIKVGDSFYRIDIIEEIVGENESGYTGQAINRSTNLGRKMLSNMYNRNKFFDDNDNVGKVPYLYVSYSLLAPTLRVNYVKIGSAIDGNEISYNITYNRSITKDSSYEIIAAPLRDTIFSNVPGVTGNFNHQGDIALLWLQNLINKYHSSNFAYDIQIVPYCPVDKFDLNSENVVFCTRNGAKLALAIQLQRATFSQNLEIEKISYRDNPKKSNELDLYRIVSPNGVGEYEWSPAKNRIAPKNFEIDCTLIPYHPYIKINPFFSGLYGADYNDYRGLICGGDFSLPIISSEWETYKLNNKYYQDIFDRTIQHQEFNNKYAEIADIFSAIGGTGQGAGSGAMAGISGGPVGMAAGAIIGGATSLAGGIADIVINKKIRSEEIQYQKDRFGYELGTIKARAQSLTRSTAFNANNKYFPYVEYYTCTEIEEEALENKLLYNGMTVGVIGKVSDYLNNDPEAPFTFIQGEIIRIEIDDDYEIVERINDIFMGGIRIA